MLKLTTDYGPLNSFPGGDAAATARSEGAYERAVFHSNLGPINERCSQTWFCLMLFPFKKVTMYIIISRYIIRFLLDDTV
jgi:hypothetical protein